jgi:flagellum-specific peptidoglycan hydrolase FlgJ
VPPINRPWWEQVTALVSLSVSGALTGFSFVPKAPAELKSPSGMPIHLLALEKAAKPAPADDTALRSAIINVTNYFLRMAENKTPAQMEAIIWHHDSIDGVDHGESCAAFASLTLELAAQAVGQQSWVTGGTSYPWPLHKWADVRVGPNPDSLGIVSVLQDAEAHHRWHPLGDGYAPLPGDWVLFDGHVEVVTQEANGVLHTVGGDSLPNFSVNAHTYAASHAAQGIVGFVNNGDVSGMGAAIPGSGEPVSGPQGNQTAPSPHQHRSGAGQRGHAGDQASLAAAGQGQRPGDALTGHGGDKHRGDDRADGRARIPGAPGRPSARLKVPHAHGEAAVPGLPVPAPRPDRDRPSASPRHQAGREEARHSHLAHEQGPQPVRAGAPPKAPGPTVASEGAGPGSAAIPGLPAAAGVPRGSARSAVPPAAPTGVLSSGTSGTSASAGGSSGSHASGTSTAPSAPAASTYGRHRPTAPTAPAYDSHAEQAFINDIAPWAMAAQRRYGVPASVTIAQAIDESGWGRSVLASNDHNLFGIKGTGPAGTHLVPTREYQNGHLVSQTSPFRVYHNIAESVDDHGKLLATSQYYRQAMADRRDPNAFAAALTGVYATDPQYGSKLIALMHRYDLYRYDAPAPGSTAHHPAPASRQHAGVPRPRVQPGTPGPTHTAAPAPVPHTADPSPAPHSHTPTTTPAAEPHTVTPTPAPHTTSPTVAPHTPADRPARRSHTPATTPPAASPSPGSDPAIPGPSDPAPPPRSSAPGITAHSAAPRRAPGRPAPGTPARRTPTQRGTAGGAAIPGLPATDTSAQVSAPRQDRPSNAPPAATLLDAYQAEPMPSASNAQPRSQPSPLDWQKQRIASRRTSPSGRRYQQHIPPSVWTVLIATARGRLLGEEPLYRDVASHSGIRWELLAACDWMQSKARPGYSPVQGEKLGTLNPDGTRYHTKSEALEQCAEDLVELAGNVYHLDLTAPGELSVRELASAFAAFRWGGLLKLHHTSAMEFPYSVAGLTGQHTSMRWPKIDEPNAPDKPGSRFRMPFGAVPIVLSLNYPATI